MHPHNHKYLRHWLLSVVSVAGGRSGRFVYISFSAFRTKFACRTNDVWTRKNGNDWLRFAALAATNSSTDDALTHSLDFFFFACGKLNACQNREKIGCRREAESSSDPKNFFSGDFPANSECIFFFVGNDKASRFSHHSPPFDVFFSS